jgi:hypothetical protein
MVESIKTNGALMFGAGDVEAYAFTGYRPVMETINNSFTQLAVAKADYSSKAPSATAIDAKNGELAYHS